MSFFKKTSAAFLASAIAVQGQAFAAIDFGTDSVSDYSMPQYEAPAALKKLVRLDTKLISTLDNAARKEIAKIRDPKTRKFYSDVNSAKKAALRELFSNLRSEMRYEFLAPDVSNAKDMVRFAAKGYVEFIGEIRAAAEKNSVGAVSADEKTAVEAEIVNFQRDLLVTPLREVIDTYAKSDVKETGEWKGSVTSPLGTVNASVDKYTSLLSMIGLSQEADFVFNSDFDLDLPGPTQYDPETYERIETPSVKVKGAVKIDANVKLVDDTAYVLLRDYSLDVTSSATGSASEEFDSQVAKAKTVLSLMKGKTVKIAMPKDEGNARPDVVVKKASEVLDILDSNSLLTPTRKVSEGKFGLSLNAKTALLISNVFGEKLTKGDVRKADKEFAASNLVIVTKDGTSTISAADPKGSGLVRMTRDASGYAFHFDGVEGNNRTVLDVSKTEMKLVSKNKTSEILGTWKDGDTSFVVNVSGQEAFKVTGTVTAKKVDAVVAVTGKDVGTVKYAKTGKDYSSDIRFEFEIPAGILDKSGKVVITSVEKGTIESGTFKIEVPKDVVDIEALIK
ncbi:MAG: hypothetical protein QMC36_08300 [Patescibacteria group bacterium]